MVKISTIIVFLFMLNNYGQCNRGVKVKQGYLIGKLWTTRKGRTFTGFTGIPYAKPPLGRLRFQAPNELTSWDGVLDATQEHAVCPQLGTYGNKVDVIGKEDCLFLNVYTPQVPENSSSGTPFSVLFYIHGGSFAYNSATPKWLGPEILLDKDVVLVTINYRLGALGFLSTGDSTIPGNNGLKDQVLALKWTKENIASFGGNPDKITIVGNSAGAASVQFLLMSPLSKGLMQGAIMQSGSVLSPFASPASDNALDIAYQLGTLVNCTSRNISELVTCLQFVEARDVILQQPTFMQSEVDISSAPFQPVVEVDAPGAFITKPLIDILNSDEVADVPVVIGMVAQEAAYQAAHITTNPDLLKTFNQDFETIVTKEFRINPNNTEFSKSLQTFYFTNQEILNTSKMEITNMYTDGAMLWETEYTIETHLKYRKSPIFLYFFEYWGSFSYVSLWDKAINLYGVCHTDELFYLLSRNSSFPKYVPTRSDEDVADLLTTLWTNFVDFGNPTPASSSSNLTVWDPVSTTNLEYYHINGTKNVHMRTNLLNERRHFWRTQMEI